MREILFRGRNPDNNEWVEGSLVHRSLFYGNPANEYFILIGGEFHCDYYNAVAVDFATIGQYTGLTDKNGAKIFEGDILLIGNNPIPLLVEFSNFSWGCANRDIYPYYRHSFDDELKYEVIGNIHDNPDLMTCREMADYLGR